LNGRIRRNAGRLVEQQDAVNSIFSRNWLHKI
jgi:hypothetical protein